MASSARKKQGAAVRKPRAAGRKTATTRKRRPRILIDDVTAVLLVSPDAKRLCEFYRAALGLPLAEETHDGAVLHYGYSLGDVHFAIHPADGWPGVRTRNAKGPVITFSTSDLDAVIERLTAQRVATTGPSDHGFGRVVSFRDPDGNPVSIVEYAPEHW
jgi:catechol 2,3-dioxygenase-like lactoylglutathione lyase family enzyme